MRTQRSAGSPISWRRRCIKTVSPDPYTRMHSGDATQGEASRAIGVHATL